MRRHLAPLLMTLTLAACTTPTAYAPLQTPSGSGFSETKIQDDRWRVTFRGGSDAGRERVADLTLLRAAQLTLQQGYDWFRITQRYGQISPSRGPTLSVGAGGGDYGWRGGSSFGVGVGGIPLGGGPQLSETLEILMARGEAPKGDPAVYDAHGVQQSIKP